MEYIYAAMLLHKAGEDINEANVSDVLEAAGVEPDESRVKALIASLEDVDIEEAIEATTVAQPTQQAPQDQTAAEEESDEDEADDEDAADEPSDDEGVSEEEAAEGLGTLFE